MSTATAEDILLEEHLDKDPPCEIRLRKDQFSRCGKPSVVRVRFSCNRCGDVVLRFICKFHYECLLMGFMLCRGCEAPAGLDLKWELI